MISPAPSFQENHISQIPTLQLLQNLGYAYFDRNTLAIDVNPSQSSLDQYLLSDCFWL